MPKKARKRSKNSTASPQIPPKTRGVARSESGTHEWRELAKDFEAAGERYKATDVQLTYSEANEDDEGGFRLVVPREHSKLMQLLINVNRLAESAFFNLAARGLLLTGNPFWKLQSRDWDWQNAVLSRWGELVVEKANPHSSLLDFFERDAPGFETRRMEYVKRIPIRFVQDSVLCCHQMEIEVLTGAPMMRDTRLYAAGLRALRDDNGIKQEVLAELLGVSRKTISLWETGKRNITREKLKWIEKTLKWKREDVVGQASLSRSRPQS